MILSVLLAVTASALSVRDLDIQKEIDRTAVKGGTVTVAPGEWEVKPFVLRSGVTLRLEEGATLLASTNAADYTGGQGEKVFIYAENAERIAIEGKGAINGRGGIFREIDKTLKGESQPQNLPVLMRFSRCRDVRLEDFTFRDGAAWGCHLRNCDGVVIRRVKAHNHVNNTNDGIDIESRNVLIEDCDLDTDDDALVFKTESDIDFAVENVEVRNCRLASCCNGIKFGTGSHADWRNIDIHDCVLSRAGANFRFAWHRKTPGVTNPITGLAAIALEVVDGGRMENVKVRNIEIKDGFQTPVFIRHHRRNEPRPGRETYLRNVLIENVKGRAESLIASSITGVPGRRVTDVVLRDIDLTLPGGDVSKWRGSEIPEQEKAYPDNHMFGYNPLPAWGFYVRHADGIRFENVKLRLASPDERPPIVAEDAEIGGEVEIVSPDRTKASFDLTPFKGGTTFTCSRLEGAADYTYTVYPHSRRYRGWRANILSDDRYATALRAYSYESGMGIGHDRLWVKVKPGESFGYAAGPREGFLDRMKAMTIAAGVPHSPGGGAWSVDGEACRRSYLHALGPSMANLDEFIRLARLGGFGNLHLREGGNHTGWYEKFGHYEVNEKLFPGGLPTLKAAVERIHAAGLSAGMHTLTACIDPEDEWVRSEDIENLLVRASYTLAAPLTASSQELLVNRVPEDCHHLVFSYSGNGNAIRIGREIVQYTGIRREKPYAFTGLKRGAWGTPVSDHAAGEKADYLLQRYLAFYPDPRSPLLGKVADRIAAVFNTCGFDQIYCDGAEGMGSDYGITAARWAIAKRLAPDGRAVINEGSHGSAAHCWWFHSRVGNLDSTHWAPKEFHDLHLDGSVQGARIENWLAPQMGWWTLKLDDFHSRLYYWDENEYFAQRNVVFDTATSMIAQLPPEGVLPFHAMRMLVNLGWYEHARLAKAFTPEALAALAPKDGGYTLRQAPKNGRWYLVKRADFGFARVESPYGALPYDTPEHRTILSAADAPKLKLAAAKLMAGRVSVRNDPERGETLVFTAENRGRDAHGAWASASREFEAPKYFDGAVAPGPSNVAMSVWIRGDGSGALLNLQLKNPKEHGEAWQEHYVDLNFTGWRHFEFTFRDNDAARWRDYEWPYRDWVGVFHRTVFRGRIGSINVYLNEVPKGGRAEVALSEVRIVPIAVKTKPAGVVPFSLESGEFAECWGGFCTKYDRNGNPLEQRRDAGMVKPSSPSKPIPAFTDEGARRIGFEAMEPIIWDPAKGFDVLPSIVIRPGEKARVEVRVYGNPEAEIAIGGVKRRGGGDFGWFEGRNQIKVDSGKRLRLDIVKRYASDIR